VQSILFGGRLILSGLTPFFGLCYLLLPYVVGGILLLYILVTAFGKPQFDGGSVIAFPATHPISGTHWFDRQNEKSRAPICK